MPVNCHSDVDIIRIWEPPPSHIYPVFWNVPSWEWVSLLLCNPLYNTAHTHTFGFVLFCFVFKLSSGKSQQFQIDLNALFVFLFVFDSGFVWWWWWWTPAGNEKLLALWIPSLYSSFNFLGPFAICLFYTPPPSLLLLLLSWPVPGRQPQNLSNSRPPSNCPWAGETRPLLVGLADVLIRDWIKSASSYWFDCVINQTLLHSVRMKHNQTIDLPGSAEKKVIKRVNEWMKG